MYHDVLLHVFQAKSIKNGSQGGLAFSPIIFTLRLKLFTFCAHLNSGTENWPWLKRYSISL